MMEQKQKQTPLIIKPDLEALKARLNSSTGMTAEEVRLQAIRNSPTRSGQQGESSARSRSNDR